MLNSVNVVGRITKDPEIKFIGSENTAVCNFGIAVNKPYKNKETNEYEADFFNVSAFGNTAEFVGTYVTKGNLIGVQGSLTTRTYEKDGQTHYVVDIRADKVLSYATKSQTIDKPVTGEKETEKDIKALMNKEFAKRSVGLDKEAKDNLLKDIRKRYQARLDAASTDLPF
mgnify:CR=1 FL=1